MSNLRSIDFQLSERLRDLEFRREWFRAQLEYGVPEQFRALRDRRHLTQTKLSEIAVMKQSAISRFEKSTDANWNFETLLKLAEAMDAQLQISVVPAEDVIARTEREERIRKDGAASVLDAPTKKVSPRSSAVAPKQADKQLENDLQPKTQSARKNEGALSWT